MEKQHGFIAISTVLLISAAVLVIATTVSLTGIGSAQSSLAVNKGENNLALVEGCADDYLLKIRSNPSFTATNITRPEGTCTVTINSGNPNWNIVISSTDPIYKRKVQVLFIRTATGITVTSWKEI